MAGRICISVTQTMASMVVFLKPAVQHVGIHAMVQGQCGNRGAGALTGSDQIGFELGTVCAVRASRRVTGQLRIFEHGVHESYVHTILLMQNASFQMGSPDA